MVPMGIPLRPAVFSHELIYLRLLALNDCQLALQIVLQSLALLPQLVVLFLDLHGQLDFLVWVAVTHLQHLILVLKSLHLSVQLLVFRREHLETSHGLVHILLPLLQLFVQVLFVVVVALDGSPLLLIVRLHEVNDLLHLAQLGHELGLLGLSLSDGLR